MAGIVDKLKIKDFNDEQSVRITDFENFLDIGTDKRNNYIYNFNQTLYVDVNKNQLPVYTCDHDMHWTLISYKLYDTTRLAWLLWKLNDIGPDRIFDIVESGTKIKYLDADSVQQIVKNINDYGDY